MAPVLAARQRIRTELVLRSRRVISADSSGEASQTVTRESPTSVQPTNPPAGSTRLRAINQTNSGTFIFSRRSSPCLGAPAVVRVGHAEEKSLSRPDRVRCERLRVSKQTARAQGLVWRILLAVCTTVVCSGQCPDCPDNSVSLSPQDDWKAGIQDAPHGSTILLLPGVYVGECNVHVRRNITLLGVNGRSETVLDCQQQNRHFHITGATVTINGLTLINGHADSWGGGCVLVDGNANVSVSGSSLAVCDTPSDGGLIKLSQNSALMLSEETELRNGSAGACGGGVFLEGKSLLTAARTVSIVDNEAAVDGG
eukprot:3430048-Rhodomonas_salina.1